MPIVSATRLRSLRFLPAFMWTTLRAERQAKRASGFLGGAVLADRALAFWTLTLWDGAEPLRAFVLAGDHRVAMQRLAGWCDEAAVVRWEAPGPGLPSWAEAHRRIAAEGRPNKVRHPSAAHLRLDHPAPRLVLGRTL